MGVFMLLFLFYICLRLISIRRFRDAFVNLNFPNKYESSILANYTDIADSRIREICAIRVIRDSDNLLPVVDKNGFR